jgi:hypothetical protein
MIIFKVGDRVTAKNCQQEGMLSHTREIIERSNSVGIIISEEDSTMPCVEWDCLNRELNQFYHHRSNLTLVERKPLPDYVKGIDDLTEMQAKALLCEVRNVIREQANKLPPLSVPQRDTTWELIFNLFEKEN